MHPRGSAPCIAIAMQGLGKSGETWMPDAMLKRQRGSLHRWKVDVGVVDAIEGVGESDETDG